MTYKINLFDTEWKKTKEVSFNSEIFNEKNVNEWLIHEFILMQLANSRNPIAHTKTRWEVASSWRKLHRQKWTWRARVWDAWSPIRRHWWVVFWPRNNVNYTKNMPHKMRVKALLWSIILKMKDGEVLWLDSFNSSKTKEAANTISKLWLEKEKGLSR